MKWHEDFHLRDRTQVHSVWPGDVVRFCGSAFNWAQVLSLPGFVKASGAVRLDDALQRTQGGAGSVPLVSGSKVQTRAGLSRVEADTSAVCVLACSKKADGLLWASLTAFALDEDCVPMAEWADDDAGLALALLVRPGLEVAHSRLPLLSGVPWTMLARFKVDERALGVGDVVRALLDVTPPKVVHWGELIAWLMLLSTDSSMRQRQTQRLSVLRDWWSRTWRVCSHDRVRVLTAQSCQLCGDPGHGLGCPLCGSHVCLSCHRLADAGWPGGSGARSGLFKRNTSLRGKLAVAAKMEAVSSRLGPLHLGPLPLAVAALWIHAHSVQGGGAQRFLLAG